MLRGPQGFEGSAGLESGSSHSWNRALSFRSYSRLGAHFGGTAPVWESETHLVETSVPCSTMWIDPPKSEGPASLPTPTVGAQVLQGDRGAQDRGRTHRGLPVPSAVAPLGPSWLFLYSSERSQSLSTGRALSTVVTSREWTAVHSVREPWDFSPG